MKKLVLDDKGFMIFENVLSEQDRRACFHDVKELVSQGYVANGFPPLQTPSDLYSRVKHFAHWDHWATLYNYMKTCMQLNLELERNWANLTVENGTYGMHEHTSDLTFCYFVRSEHPIYGTNVEDKFILPAVENSMIVFNGKIRHSISNMPNELVPKNDYNRCSIVFDFNVIK
tara:strand:- start:2443 stop:2961 length:519 start_codon:yes stop_codon:yes gene_type:complete